MLSWTVLIVSVCSITGLVVRDPQWETYKLDFNKTYTDPDEELYRRQIWLDNRKLVERHNREADVGVHTYWLKINHLADMTSEEVHNVMHGLNVKVDLQSTEELLFKGNSSLFNEVVPPRIDWREKGVVTPVKYQGHCGSCYAFSSTGAIEALHAKMTGRLVSLSEQNLVDCSQRYGDHGCHGGLMDHAFTYIIRNGGIDTEVSYPYDAEVGYCHYRRVNRGARIGGFVRVLPRGDERKLQIAVGTVGPVSIGIDSREFGFHLYSHGVYSSSFCSKTHLSHAVLAVGYGTDYFGQEYWLVKNSWGKYWGEQGYVRMARNRGNMCGIASLASYPTHFRTD